MTVTCFWLEETGTARVGLRRYRSRTAPGGECPLADGFHHATWHIGTAMISRAAGDDGPAWERPQFGYPGHDDARWPAACACGLQFTPDDAWQEWSEPLYRRGDTGALVTLRSAPDGAMWDAWWMPWKGPDGRCITVRCPGGADWAIDSRASNCTMPGDDEHRCWIRHGEPPALTVNKAGKTCAAGAGSIQAGGYHGFLAGGRFT